MKKLTREEAIQEHRKMWNWIAHETAITDRSVCKFDFFKNQKEYDARRYLELPRNFCWCCEYNKQKSLEENMRVSDCRFCPINWDQEHIPIACEKTHSLYRAWRETKDIFIKAQLAKQIANLPEREID